MAGELTSGFQVGFSAADLGLQRKEERRQREIEMEALKMGQESIRDFFKGEEERIADKKGAVDAAVTLDEIFRIPKGPLRKSAVDAFRETVQQKYGADISKPLTSLMGSAEREDVSPILSSLVEQIKTNPEFGSDRIKALLTSSEVAGRILTSRKKEPPKKKRNDLKGQIQAQQDRINRMKSISVPSYGEASQKQAKAWEDRIKIEEEKLNLLLERESKQLTESDFSALQYQRRQKKEELTGSDNPDERAQLVEEIDELDRRIESIIEGKQTVYDKTGSEFAKDDLKELSKSIREKSSTASNTVSSILAAKEQFRRLRAQGDELGALSGVRGDIAKLFKAAGWDDIASSIANADSIDVTKAIINDQVLNRISTITLTPVSDRDLTQVGKTVANINNSIDANLMIMRLMQEAAHDALLEQALFDESTSVPGTADERRTAFLEKRKFLTDPNRRRYLAWDEGGKRRDIFFHEFYDKAKRKGLPPAKIIEMWNAEVERLQ